jgi:hypothetical protein
VLRAGLSTAIAAAKLGAVASHPRRVVDRATRGRHTSLEPSSSSGGVVVVVAIATATHACSVAGSQRRNEILIPVEF